MSRKLVNFLIFISILFSLLIVSESVKFYPCPQKESHKFQRREPLQIVTIKTKANDKTQKFELNEDKLLSILIDQVGDRPVVVLSIAGDFRKGKSFFLNLLLRYLHSGGDDKGWLSKDDSPIKGFSWRGGSERDTSGLLMWSEAFCFMHPSGEEVAIVLMDTQGAFDGENNIGDTATIFALSFLTSSIQIYNLMRQIQEDNLQYLEILIKYGKLMKDESDGHKPFQKLLFLVRDWPKSYSVKYNFGFTGGQSYLNTKLESKTKNDEQLRLVRDKIKHSFDDLACFLMPHPGLRVEEEEFNGKPSHIEQTFLAQVEKLVSTLFEPESLVTKRVFDTEVSGNRLFVQILS